MMADPAGPMNLRTGQALAVVVGAGDGGISAALRQGTDTAAPPRSTTT